MAKTWTFVGRERELRRVSEALGRDAAGVVVAGAAGIGKTRLAREAVAALPGGGWAVLWAVATRTAASIPYGALAQLVPDPGEQPLSRLDQLRRTVAHLQEQAGGGRLVLGVDDAHLLDDASAALVHHVATTRAVRLVVTVRTGEPAPDAITALWKDDLLARVDVAPLSAPQVGELVQAVVGERVDPATSHLLWQLSQGNPLYLRELVDDALERGLLRPVDGVWRSDEALGVGTRLVELVESRMGRLDPELRAVCELVAFAEPLEAALLETLAPAPATAEAERAGLLDVTEDARRVLVRLAHPLYGEVVRADTPVLRARALQRQLADALEATGGRRSPDLLRIAVWRLHGGGDADPELLTTAARRATALFDPDLGVRLGEAAMAAGGGFEAELATAEALHQQGRADEAEARLAELASRAEDEPDAMRVALVRAMNLVAGFGRTTDAEQIIRAAEQQAPAPGFGDELAALRGTIALNQGRVDEALAAVTPALGRHPPDPPALLRALLVAVPAWSQAGQLDAATGAGEQALQAVPEHELPFAAELLRLGLCYAYGLAGRFGAAGELAEGRYQAMLEQGARDLRAGWASARGQLALATGCVRTARDWFQEAATLLRTQPTGFGVFSLAWCLGGLAEAAALAGDAEAAQQAMAEADRVTPEPAFVPQRELGRVWVSVVCAGLGAGREQALQVADAAAERGARAVEAVALHQVARLGQAAVVSDRLGPLASEIGGELMGAYAAHTVASAAGDPAGLEAASAAFEQMGARLLAAEAAAEAAQAHGRAGRQASARAAGARAHELASRCEGAASPLLELASELQALTPREREIATLAASGLSNQAIAERLVISVRTVDNHLHRAYTKLGVSGRDELGFVLGPVDTD